MDYINMVAPYQGVLEWVGEPKEWTSSSGNNYKNVNFTLKYLGQQMREQYITFSMSGPDKVDKLLALPMGSEIRVLWNPTSNRYVDREGREQWFPQLSAYRVVLLQPRESESPGQDPDPQQPPLRPGAQTQPAQPQDPTDDLPI